MTWLDSDPKGKITGETFAPYALFHRGSLWQRHVRIIDDTSSDLRVLDVIAALISFYEPLIIVEAGTYRGIGAICMAETLRTCDVPGHVWTCDPVDYGVEEILREVDLTERVTYVKGGLEQLLPMLPAPLNFAYIDASAPNQGDLRARYVSLALQHAAPGALVLVDDVASEWPNSLELRTFANVCLMAKRGLAIFQK